MQAGPARRRRATIIGAVGTTGLSTGPHLDYRMIKNGVFVEPAASCSRRRPSRSPPPSASAFEAERVAAARAPRLVRPGWPTRRAARRAAGRPLARGRGCHGQQHPAALLVFVPDRHLPGADPRLARPGSSSSRCLAILPLAGLMGEATEHLTHHTGPGIGGLLNASFGNAAELIIAFIALRAGETEIVKASLTGSIIGNMLMVLGLAMLLGGWKHKELKFSRIAAESGSSMMVLAVVALVIPAIYAQRHAPQATRRTSSRSASTSPGCCSSPTPPACSSQLKSHKHLFARRGRRRRTTSARRPRLVGGQEHRRAGRGRRLRGLDQRVPRARGGRGRRRAWAWARSSWAWWWWPSSATPPSTPPPCSWP